MKRVLRNPVPVAEVAVDSVEADAAEAVSAIAGKSAWS